MSERGEGIPMGSVVLMKAGELLIETGIAYGACVLAIAAIDNALYKVAHIPPGSIVREVSALLQESINGQVTVYQHGVSGYVEDLARLIVQGGGTGTILTSIKMIKYMFKRRDRAAGLY